MELMLHNIVGISITTKKIGTDASRSWLSIELTDSDDHTHEVTAWPVRGEIVPPITFNPPEV